MPEDASTRKLATNGGNIGNAAASAGLAGLLVVAVASGVEAGIESAQRSRMRKALEGQNFDAEAIFDAALMNSLATEGYTLSSVEYERENYTEFSPIKEDPNAEPDSAVLDVASVSYGYQLVGGNTLWRPFMYVKARMTDPADPSKVLMENIIAYNPVATPETIVNIPSEDTYGFESIEELEANPKRAAEGLRVAIERTAEAIAKLLY